MENNNEHISIDLIARYIAKETSANENEELETWLAKDLENKKIFEEYQRTWQQLEQFKDKSVIDIDEEWKKMDNVITTKAIRITEKPSFFHTFSRIAAVFLIVLLSGAGIAFLANHLRYETIKTANNTQEISLPDGSSISLNFHSKIKYAKKFNDLNRNVFLQGEAYFSVERDTSRPFIINTSNAEIEVLGTTFNVKAYKENSDIEVVVTEGKVALGAKNKRNEKIVLTTGEKGIFDKKLVKAKHSNNTNPNYNAWRTKKFIFENARLLDVVNELNAAYGSNIVIRSDKITECRITSTFNQQSLDAILTILENILSVQITKSDKIIIITGEEC